MRDVLAKKNLSGSMSFHSSLIGVGMQRSSFAETQRVFVTPKKRYASEMAMTLIAPSCPKS
jgi:hypothetical protein